MIKISQKYFCEIMKARKKHMARNYEIPPDTSEKEKAIGGILTFGQFGWLIGGVVIALLVFVVIYLITRVEVVSIIFAIPFALLGVPFAFYKKYEMTLLKYLITKKRFDMKIKNLTNKH